MSPQKNWNQRENANKCVNVYWSEEFIASLDELCAKLGVKRNEFIKEAVRAKAAKERRQLAKSDD